MEQTVDLALIGNGSIGALVSPDAKIVWTCIPHFDGDPVFCSLLRGTAQPESDGSFSIEMPGVVRSEQHYVPDTPILVSRFFDESGAGIRVTDFAPRYRQGEKLHSPSALWRKIERIAGNPTVRIRLRPMEGYGAKRLTPNVDAARKDSGSTHKCIRYVGEQFSLLLTTNAPVDAIVDETPFALNETVTLAYGLEDDEEEAATPGSDDPLEQTVAWWHHWVRSLSVPTEWRDAVVRAAITLKLNVAQGTGAIIAAMTTSIPETPDSGRNWDYRYSWLRDAYFVVDALYRLGDSATTEQYVDYVMRLVAGAKGGELRPMYTITGGPVPDEHEAEDLRGFRDMGPVRVGNQAYVQTQHDVYGEAILAAKPLFTGNVKTRQREADLFRRLEGLGNRAARVYDKPDAGLWELRGIERVHTFSSVMCWAACDALAEIAHRLELDDRAATWRVKADEIHKAINQRSWNPRLSAFTAAMDGDTLDASLLLMQPLGFLEADDPRYVSTVRAIGRDLRRGDFIFRYVEKDDFGQPDNAFLVCTLWYVDALAAMGEREEARRLFNNVLSCRNRLGLLAEHLDPRTREQWGNFVQTYSMAGIITSAIRLA